MKLGRTDISDNLFFIPSMAFNSACQCVGLSDNRDGKVLRAVGMISLLFSTEFMHVTTFKFAVAVIWARVIIPNGLHCLEPRQRSHCQDARLDLVARPQHSTALLYSSCTRLLASLEVFSALHQRKGSVASKSFG